MSDGEREKIREVFDRLRISASKVKHGSDKWVHFVAAAMALGWVLDEPVYRENMEVLLGELRAFTSGLVIADGKK